METNIEGWVINRKKNNQIFNKIFPDKCDPNPCQNGGTCRKKDGTCKCHPNWSGKYCQTRAGT